MLNGLIIILPLPEGESPRPGGGVVVFGQKIYYKLMDLITYGLVFISGLIVGSFVNAVVFRFEREENALHGRSKCFSCNHVLSWIDLVPVFSYLFLKGKCRYCHANGGGAHAG